MGIVFLWYTVDSEHLTKGLTADPATDIGGDCFRQGGRRAPQFRRRRQSGRAAETEREDMDLPEITMRALTARALRP